MCTFITSFSPFHKMLHCCGIYCLLSHIVVKHYNNIPVYMCSLLICSSYRMLFLHRSGSQCLLTCLNASARESTSPSTPWKLDCHDKHMQYAILYTLYTMLHCIQALNHAILSSSLFYARLTLQENLFCRRGGRVNSRRYEKERLASCSI